MYSELLPIGSIVLLKGGNKRLMICGRIQTRQGEDTIYDYCGCYYPEGIEPGNMFFFNRDAIDTLFFVGFQDAEELQLRENVFANLGELQVVDGQIVPKE
ncbi:MAG: DUF4176 domain-containing protein [Oliverpabstia intestinalis]|nr:DUF4176 domain-containing protein [Oliverpabstia intestinalis]MDY5791471.1 DUF4176 domain-containing protein [Oliverpabstia intestinalis]